MDVNETSYIRPTLLQSLYNKHSLQPLHSFLYKLGPLTFCVLVVASLFGSIPAFADEAQPTSQALASPTTEAQPTEVAVSEPTVEIAPTNPPTIIPTIYVPPTETFRVIEMRTRVATYAPPTPIPTSGVTEPTIATSPPAHPSEPVISDTPTPEGAYAPGVPTAADANVEEPVPVDTAIALTSTISPESYTTTAPITGTVTTTDIPYWVPGPECSLEQGKIVVNLPVPYIHQVLDIGGANGSWACGPTSVAMVLAYYGKLEPWQDYLVRQAATPTAGITNYELRITNGTSSNISAPEAGKTKTSTPVAKAQNSKSRVDTPYGTPRPGLSFAPYVTEEYTRDGFTYSATAQDPSGNSVAGLYGTICPSGLADWSRMAFVLQQHGLSGRHIPVTWEGIIAALDRGHPVILGNDLTSVGHIIVAVGYTDNGNLIVNDPYGDRFASGYGGTRGGGLFYPWSCARTRNAYEVIGVYSPPADIVVPAASGLNPAVLYMNETPWLVSMTLKSVQPTATPSPTAAPTASPTRVALRATKADTSVRAPGTAAATAVISGWTSDAQQQDVLGWGLFSMLSLAATFVGVSSFRKTRRGYVEADVTPTPEVSDSAVKPRAGAIQAGTIAFSRHGDVETSDAELAEQESQPAVSEPKRSRMPTPPGGLQLVLRRTLPLALPLLLLGLKLYSTSKGQEDARTRITNETKQLMIRNL